MADKRKQTLAEAGLAGQARRVAGVLLFERLWPLVVAVLVLAGLFLAVSWFGLWLVLPRYLRIAGVAGFGGAFAYILWHAARLRWPGLTERLARLDRDSGQPHHPASALVDRIANAQADAGTQALWALHQARMAQASAQIVAAPPKPNVPKRDRFALRAGVLLAVAAGAFVAGSQRDIRVAAAFDWRGHFTPPEGFRVDAWLNPPLYTGRPPILLTFPANGEAAPQSHIDAPVHSVLIVHSANAPDLAMDAQKGLAAQKQADGGTQYILDGDGSVNFSAQGSRLAGFDLHAIPDLPPAIQLTQPPKANARGSLTLNYKTSDDYGVVSAKAIFSDPVFDEKAYSGRHLVELPDMALDLPGTATGIGEAQTTADLSDSPYAGARVSLTLQARDGAGQTGRSRPQTMELPRRPFSNPLALALVEQRRDLLLDPDHFPRVRQSIEALLIAPELFKPNAETYLGMLHVDHTLQRVQGDPDLVKTADFLWQMALHLEDGDIPQTMQALRAAQERLRRALQKGAPEAQIRKLMDDVRTAMNNFMKEMARKAQRDGPHSQMQANQNTRIITPKDMQSLMDQIEQAARAGDMASAQKLLDQLQKTLENLRNAKPGKADPNQKGMAKALSDLDRLTRNQQDLRDDTFSEQQKQEDGKPSPGVQQSLQQRQGGLREGLDKLQKQMQQMGGKGDPNLDEAGKAMKEAEQELGMAGKGQGQPAENGGGQPGGQGQGQGRGQGNGQAGGQDAVAAQGRALGALRKGAQALAKAMQKGQGQGKGTGEGTGTGMGRNDGNGRDGRDPLGRSQDGLGRNVADGQPLQGASPAQQAQTILRELRKRLSDPNLPLQEKAYIEQLLRME
ncbi:MAG: TIGR02302 family protein [Hyphomicrobiales bacterium]|nr:TIGR02302 family protein [Hyphomicrobiales bacterium]MDE2115484.1 TIGR02302 family protein [Hyphomicrobiales bacterium]